MWEALRLVVVKAVEVVVNLMEPLVGLNWPDFVDLVDSDLSRDGSLYILTCVRDIVDDDHLPKECYRSAKEGTTLLDQQSQRENCPLHG